MKKLIFSFAFLSALFLTFSISGEGEVHATSNQEITLENKGYSEAEIDSMSDITKDKLANSKGVRADYTVKQKEYYNSLDGNKYEVTEENRDEINKIMNRDIAQYAEENGVSVLKFQSPMVGISSFSNGDYYEDSNLSVSAFVDKIPSSNPSTEYAYAAFFDFSWYNYPNVTWTDDIGFAWDNRFIGVANTLSDYYTYLYANQYMYSKSVNATQELYGIKGRFTLESSNYQIGGMSQEIKVPTMYAGQTGKFQAKYVHALIPFTGAVSLGPASVNVPTDFISQEFVLDFNIKIGS